MTTIVLQINLKNAISGKRASKILKWASLRPLASKIKLYDSFNFETIILEFVWKMLLCSPTMFPYKPGIRLKI